MADDPTDMAEAIRKAYETGGFRPKLVHSSDPGADKPEAKSGLTITWMRDVGAVLESADLVEDLLGIGGMCVIYGESGCGKTFFATDLALHIALGWTWNSRYVEKLGVVYCAMEGGARGIQNRLAAFLKAHDVDPADVPFGFVTSPLDMRSSEADADAVIAEIKREAVRLHFRVGLVVIDTVARSLAGGEENGSADMGALVKNGDRIRAETGAALAWVHHSGKDATKGARGHGSLRAATDTEIEITAEGGVRTARVTKQREYECSGAFTFGLKVVELGLNPRGKMVTSCVVDYDAEATPAARSGRRDLTGHARRAYDVLVDLCVQSGSLDCFGVPEGCRAVTEKAWRGAFFDRTPGENDKTKYQAFTRASLTLINGSHVGMAERHAWVVAREAQNST